MKSRPKYLTKSRFKLAPECETKLFYTGKREYRDKKLDDSFLAYAPMQFSEMLETEKAQLEKALLKYCELDTFVMVLIWEYLNSGTEQP